VDFVSDVLFLIRLNVLVETENLHSSKLEKGLYESKIKI
jgi:hypothetical protein